MIAVGVVGVALGGTQYARKWARLAESRRRLEVQQAFFDEGRIMPLRLVEASRIVLEAEVDLCLTTSGKVAAISQFVDQGDRLVARERKELETSLDCWGVGRHQLEELEANIAEVRAVRDRLLVESR